MPDNRPTDKYQQNGKSGGTATLERPAQSSGQLPAKAPPKPLLPSAPKFALPSLSLPRLRLAKAWTRALPKVRATLRPLQTIGRPFLIGGIISAIFLGLVLSFGLGRITAPAHTTYVSVKGGGSVQTAAQTSQQSLANTSPQQLALAMVQGASMMHGTFTEQQNANQLILTENTHARLSRAGIRSELLDLFTALSSWTPDPAIADVRIVLEQPLPSGGMHAYASASLLVYTLASINWNDVSPDEAWQIYQP